MKTRDSILILVRHGETEGNSSIRYYGRTDIGLSQAGREQMRAARAELRKRIGEIDSARLFSSPLGRAVESARLVASEDSTPLILEEFRELDFGLFEGLTADEIRLHYPAEYARWNSDRCSPNFTFPKGDNRAAFATRVGRGLDRMVELWEPASSQVPALVVAHRGVIRTIVKGLTGAEPIAELASIQLLARNAAWRVLHLDLMDHLERR